MNTKCPCCGAINSLDSLISNNDASAALAAVVQLDAELGAAVIKYCGLFRPAKTQLTFARLASLINELLPAVKSQRIERNKQLFDASVESWLYAIDVLLTKREKRELTLPLKSHGYLFEVMSKYEPESGIVNTVPVAPHQPHNPQGKKSQRAHALQSMKR